MRIPGTTFSDTPSIKFIWVIYGLLGEQNPLKEPLSFHESKEGAEKRLIKIKEKRKNEFNTYSIKEEILNK